MNAARDEHPIDPPDDDPPVDHLAVAVDVLTGMQATIDQLQADMRRKDWQRLVESQAATKPAEVWRPLKAAAMDVEHPGCSERQRKANYEAVRKWCELGVIVAEKRGGHWFVRMDSLQRHVTALRGK
jgi:hypothetical protein